MIKKILFLAAIFTAGVASAQTFQLMDHNNVDIGGTNHYEYGSALDMSETKFHVKNLSGSTASYTCKVYEISNQPNTDLQVCYGSNCYTGAASTSGAQAVGGSASVASGATDLTFKVAPFTFSWAAGDSATWRVVIYNVSDVNDSAAAVITWKVNPTSIDELSANSVKFSAYPNPTSGDLTVNYNIDVEDANNTLAVYDVVGKKVKSYTLLKNKGQLKLNVSDLNPGVYFYTVNVNGKALKTERVIVR